MWGFSTWKPPNGTTNVPWTPEFGHPPKKIQRGHIFGKVGWKSEDVDVFFVLNIDTVDGSEIRLTTCYYLWNNMKNVDKHDNLPINWCKHELVGAFGEVFLVNLTCFHHFSEQNGYFHPKESLFWSKHGLNFLIDMELVENGEEFRILIFQHQKQLPSSIISQINPTVRPHFQPAMVCRILKGHKWMDVDEKFQENLIVPPSMSQISYQCTPDVPRSPCWC